MMLKVMWRWLLGLVRRIPRWLFSVMTCLAFCLLAVHYQSKYVRTSSCNLDNISMDNKVVVITGGNSGIGYQIALEMAKRKARVVLGCRHPERGQAARQAIVRQTSTKSLAVIGLDLSDMRKVHKFYDKFVEDYGKIDVLINNAATGRISSQRQVTANGLENTLAVNHLGPMYLTQLLAPLLTADGKVLTVSCEGNLYSDEVDVTDLNSETRYDPVKLYNRTKLLNIMMSRKVAQILKPGQSSFSLDPGTTWTNLYADLHAPLHHDLTTRIQKVEAGAGGWLRWLGGPLLHQAACPSLSWQTALWLAAKGSPDDSGQHFHDCRVDRKLHPAAHDQHLIQQVWEHSQALIESAFQS